MGRTNGSDARAAVAMVAVDPAAGYLAGGTTQVDLMLKDGIVSPERLVGITRLPLKCTLEVTSPVGGGTALLIEMPVG